MKKLYSLIIFTLFGTFALCQSNATAVNPSGNLQKKAASPTTVTPEYLNQIENDKTYKFKTVNAKKPSQNMNYKDEVFIREEKIINQAPKN